MSSVQLLSTALLFVAHNNFIRRFRISPVKNCHERECSTESLEFNEVTVYTFMQFADSEDFKLNRFFCLQQT